MNIFRDGEPVTVVDFLDRRKRYELVYDEESDTLGCLWYDVGRLRCTCAAGKQCYEDRLDGDGSAQPCVHERVLLDYNRRTAIEGERAGARCADAPPNIAAFVD